MSTVVTRFITQIALEKINRWLSITNCNIVLCRDIINPAISYDISKLLTDCL